MSHEYLTIRDGVWQYCRRVPAHFAHLDKRGTVKLDQDQGRQGSRGQQGQPRRCPAELGPGSLLAWPVRTEHHRGRARL